MPSGNRANLTNEGKGRPKGSKNKFGPTLREAILASFHKLGGVDYLEEQGRENPTAYLMLLKAVLPMQVTGEGGGPVMIVTGVLRPGEGDEEFGSGVIDHEPRPEFPVPAPDAEDSEVPEEPEEPNPDPPVMCARGMTRSGLAMREVPIAPPTHEGRTLVTESGLRIRTAVPVDED